MEYVTPHPSVPGRTQGNTRSRIRSLNANTKVSTCWLYGFGLYLIMPNLSLDHKEGWVLKNWYFWTVVLEMTLESPWDYKEIKPVHPKVNQSWISIGGTEVEAAILWPPDMKNWLIGKDSDAERDWGQEEKGMTEDEMAGWPHRLNGHEFGWTLGVGDGQGGLVCCGSWGHKEWYMTEWLSWTDNNI